MTHEELRDRLLDLAYGELAPGDAREVEAHAAACESCRAELAAIRGTRQVMSALPVEPAPQGPERILVAAARQAVSARAPRRAWPRWLWAAPVVAASLAAVLAVSLRLGPIRPPSAGREDPDALRGDAPVALQAAPEAAPHAPPEAAAQAPAAAPAEPAAKGAPAAPPARDEARVAAKKAEAPRRLDAAEPRFATPPGASAPRPSPPLRGGEGERAAERYAAAPEAPSPPLRDGGRAAERYATAPPPAAAPPAPSAPPAVADAAPRGPAVGALAMAPERARAEVDGQAGASRAAAPAPAPARRAKAAETAKVAEAADPSGEGRPVVPRSLATEAAWAHARGLGVDPARMATHVTAPQTWAAWRAQHPALEPRAPRAALEGRRFWAVELAPVDGQGGAPLTVFVEDGTFRPLGDVRGR